MDPTKVSVPDINNYIINIINGVRLMVPGRRTSSATKMWQPNQPTSVCPAAIPLINRLKEETIAVYIIS